MQMDANAILPIYIDIDIHIGINIDRDLSIYKDRNIDFNKVRLVAAKFRASASNPMPNFYVIHNLTCMVRKGVTLYIIMSRSRCLMVFLVQKKKKVVGVRFGDGLLLTESVVEDAHRHLNGTTRPFYRTVADIKHYLPDTQNKKQTQSHRIRSVEYTKH